MSLNILLIAGEDSVPVCELSEASHRLVPISLEAFQADSSVRPEADVILVAGAPAARAVAQWRSLGDGRPPLLVLDDQAQYEAQPDLLVLPPSTPVVVQEACLRLLAESRNARLEAAKLQARLASDHRQLRNALKQFIPSHSLKDKALRWWVRNSDAIEGELLLAARTPSGELNVMAVRGGWSVFPIIAPFYRMSEKGFGIEAILLEMHTRLLRSNPVGQPIEAAMVSVNFQLGAARVWYAGNPAPLLLRGSKNETPVVAETRSPLGAASASPFQADSWVWSVREGDRLVLCSNGLVRVLDAEEWDSAAIGRLESLIASGEGSNPLRSLPGDGDKMLVVVDCSSTHARAEKPKQKLVLPPAIAAAERWKLALTIGPEEMRKVDIVPLLLGVVGQFQSIQQRTGQLFLILAELYNNALDHGVLQLDSRLKCGPDGMATYLDERSRRLSSLATGSIDITLALESQDSGNLSLWIVCRDSGAGFDHRLARSQRASGEINTLPFGRGLSLVESEASSLEFNEEGNEVRVSLSLNAPSVTVSA